MRLHLVSVIVLAVASGGLGACGGGGGGGGGQIARTSLSGTVNGLRGSGLTVAVNSGTPTPLVADGAFTLPVRIPVGSTYHVSVVTQPKAPSQTCVIANGDGQAGAGNISSIEVTCSTNRFTVGGTLAGLIVPGSELILSNRLADDQYDDLVLTTNAAFTFNEPVESGAPYEILGEFQWLFEPVRQFCRTENGSGTVGDRNVTNVSVTCTSDFPYTLGGTVSGLLAGSKVPLGSCGHYSYYCAPDNSFEIASNGPFMFPKRLASGEPYDAYVNAGALSDPRQVCTIENGRGTVAAANVTNLVVACRLATFAVGGSVIGLTGSGLVLQDNGVDDLRVSADGRFAFATPVGSGAPYDVTVHAQPTNPAQTCYVTRGSGVIDLAAVDDVLVNCHPRIQTVTGTATGITGTGIVLRNNGGDDLVIASHGPFAFSTTMATGDEYHVTVDQQPTDAARHCSVSNGVGIVGAAGVSDIRVQCTVVGRRIYVPTWAPLENSLTHPGIYMFSWDPATERFQLLAGSPIPYGAHIAVAPDGTFAVVHLWRSGYVINRLALYGIDLTGKLVPVPGAASLPLLDATLVDAAIDPSSRYLYFVQSGDDRVFAYFNAAGSLTAVPGGPFGRPGRDGANHLTFDPQGRFLFVANARARTFSAFVIDRGTGALTEFADSPYSLAFEPQDLNVESQGRYLYVTSPTAQLVPYVIDGFDGSTGSLRPAPAAPFAPASIQGGRYGFDPNSNRIWYLAWCGGACRPVFEVSWGLWRLAVDEKGAVHPLGDAEFLAATGQFTSFESPQFDPSGNFVCFLREDHGAPYGSFGCFLIDATTGALGRRILFWNFDYMHAEPFAITH